ncbi:MAG: ester cyclase [Gemmatimonadales bacterium]
MSRRPRLVTALPMLLLASASACGGAATADPGADRNRELVQQFVTEADQQTTPEAFRAFIDRWMTPDFTSHAPGMPPADLTAYKAVIDVYMTAFSEFKHEIVQSVAEGDRVAAVVRITCKHSGEFQGIKPTGRTVTVDEIVLFRFANGKIAEEWYVFDEAGLMRQLSAPADSAHQQH